MALNELAQRGRNWVSNDYIRGKFEVLDLGLLLEEAHVCQRFHAQGLLVDKFILRQVPAVDHRCQVPLVNRLPRHHVDLQNKFTPVLLVRR